jgi:hypothetical protein
MFVAWPTFSEMVMNSVMSQRKRCHKGEAFYHFLKSILACFVSFCKAYFKSLTNIQGCLAHYAVIMSRILSK